MANFNNSRVLHSGILSKHELFRIIGDQLTSKNVQDLVVKHDDLLVGSLGPLVVDGYSFFLALESVGNVVDTSDILKILTMCGRMDLAQFANYRRRKTVEMDPVDQYLEQTAKSSVMLPSWMQRQHSWVRCSLRGQDLKEEGAGSSRPGSSNGAESSSSSCSPSTSKSQQTAEAQPAPSPSTSKQTTPSGVKRKRRRGSLTYNKSHNRLKRSRTVEALPVSKCLREQGESTNQIKGDQPAGQSSLRSSSNISDSSINEINRRVTRSRTRSAGVPLMSGVGTYSRPGSGVCDNVRSSVPADVRSSNKTEATSEVPTTSAASTNSSSHSSHNSSSPQAASTSLSQQENSKVAPDLKDNDSSAVSASTTNSVEDQTSESSSTGGSNNRALDFEEIKKKVTCDIRLRVRAEYCYHDSALDGNIFSNKPELIERQFEKFMQANTILKSRDLGSIICDIKFSELTYLDAFWRDYINGSLLEALKGVFITDSLKQAVGHEAIKLLVNVDEDDYESGRFKLLQNLKD